MGKEKKADSGQVRADLYPVLMSRIYINFQSFKLYRQGPFLLPKLLQQGCEKTKGVLFLFIYFFNPPLRIHFYQF